MKRILLICGHYGSGKTNIALSIALRMAADGKPVTLADLDIVNPYFRSSDSAGELKTAGVRLIVSPYAGTNVDVPALPQEMYAITQDTTRYAVVDVGGDDRGALALGRLRPEILSENNYENWFVFNQSRPLTSTAADALDIMREIESACGIPFTGILNNTNLGRETTAQIVLSSMDSARELQNLSHLPMKGVCVMQSLADEFGGEIDSVPVYPVLLQKTVW